MKLSVTAAILLFAMTLTAATGACAASQASGPHFNPQPDPPGAHKVDFNPQPDPPGFRG